MDVLMPWDVPPLVVAKVTPQEIIDTLRATVNKFYMPTATSCRMFNSKPTYVNGGVDRMITTMDRYAFDNGSGYYADAEGPTPNGVYAALHVGTFIIAVKLQTEECWIRQYEADTPFHRWTDQPVALDRVELAKVFDENM